MYRVIALVVLTICSAGTSAFRGRESVGFALTRGHMDGGPVVGTLIAFNLSDPSAGEVIGSTGLTQVGAMDFFDGILWVASARDDRLRFYTIDIKTGEAELEAKVSGSFGSGVFSGSFDDDGYFWVLDTRHRKIRQIDPSTGKEEHSVPIPSRVGYNGLAFVDGILYAVRGATGDPPQEFGTIDTKTGEFTRIGYTRVGVEGKGGGNGCGALDYDAGTDTLYAVYRQGVAKSQRWSLYTIDFDTGLASFVGEIDPRGIYDGFAITR